MHIKSQHRLGPYYLLLMILLSGIQLIDVYRHPPQPQVYYSIISCWGYASLLFLSLVAFMASLYERNSTNTSYFYIYVGLMAILTLMITYSLHAKRWHMFMSQNWSVNKQSDKLCRYVYAMMILVDKCDDVVFKDLVHAELSQFMCLHQKSVFYGDVKELVKDILTGSRY